MLKSGTFVAMKHLFAIILSFLPLLAIGAEVVADSTYVVETVAVRAVKQGADLRLEPLSSTVLGSIALENNQVSAISDLRTIIPNFYMPEYGSRITSSIYVRGLGARIDNPVVGLNINNTPLLNKNAFDMEVMDIAKMEILRGPQSTLYGRNTMGGVINIYTLSPMDFEGIKLSADYSSGNTYRVRGSLYERLSDRLGFAISGYYGSSDGLFENSYTGEMCDRYTEGGGSLRILYKASSRTTIDNTTTISTLDQGGYPYRLLNSDEVSYNDPSSYDRTTVSSGLTIQHRRESYTLTSTTGYQYLDDSMTLDNDFTPESIFTLTQAIREHSFTEDITLRSNNSNKRYNYILGAFGFYKNQKMDAPVTFKEDGIQQLIIDNIPTTDTYVWNSDSFILDSDIKTQTIGAALYHQSSYKAGRWEFTAGVRLDYEMAMLDYHSFANTGATRYDSDGELVWDKVLDIDLEGTPNIDFLEILPKATATFRIDSKNSLYWSATKGYKAGGYNTQMFSDILQQELMERFGLSALYSAEEIISYLPEYSWNYEMGGHFANKNNTLTADVALFYIACRDQQLTVFPDDMVTGRLMTNAGESRSYGAELSLNARRGGFAMNASYGYTNAKFVEYNDGEQDYAGNYIPYAPQHTLYASASYTFTTNSRTIRNIVLEANTSGAGKIYWSEDNTVSQPLYALVGASATLRNSNYSLSIWGRNITDKVYNTFYFESMDNEFVQQANPATFGATLNITINRQ